MVQLVSMLSALLRGVGSSLTGSPYVFFSVGRLSTTNVTENVTLVVVASVSKRSILLGLGQKSHKEAQYLGFRGFWAYPGILDAF